LRRHERPFSRVFEHKNLRGSRFTTQYNISILVWFETYANINEAIAREKRIKHWNRAWKLALIEANNPTWRDLYDELNG